MRPLPRVHAITDERVLGLQDLGIRAAAIAAAGPAVALHARAPGSGGARLTALATRFLALARPPEAAVLVNGHPEIARGISAQGVQLRQGDLAPGDARTILPSGWIGVSVHSPGEAEAAAKAGADFILAGPVYPTESHPGQPGQGPELIRSCARLGLPVIAIGGITAVRVAEVRDAGAWGVAAISALWNATDPAQAALALLEPWQEEA